MADSLWRKNLVLTKSPRKSVQAAWARFIKRTTRNSGATWLSRSCLKHFAHDPERLSRFQREAKMLAALNHPKHRNNSWTRTIWRHKLSRMELVPGETLAGRVEQEGAVPVEEALSIAKQIAEALEAAHEKGIIHRDLKPRQCEGHS